MKIFVRVKGWKWVGENRLRVYFFTWDGKCTCTAKHNREDINFTDPEPEKREVHKAILEQLYDN